MRAFIFSTVSVSPRQPFTWARPVMPGRSAEMLDFVADAAAAAAVCSALLFRGKPICAELSQP